MSSEGEIEYKRDATRDRLTSLILGVQIDISLLQHFYEKSKRQQISKQLK